MNFHSRLPLVIEGLLRLFADFLFPPFCLTCGRLLAKGEKIFCQHCLVQLALVEIGERCPKCFGTAERGLRSVCTACRKRRLPWVQAASAFDYEGPAKDLVVQLKYGGRLFLAKVLASYMTVQLSRLLWPFPDVIVPVPLSGVRKLLRGYNQSAQIARELGAIIDRPVVEALQRVSGGFPQASLSSSQRKELNAGLFSLVKPAQLEGKTVLLVDDVMTTGTTLVRSAEILIDAFPKNIYVLTACRAQLEQVGV